MPSAARELTYPADPSKLHGLTDGVGLQAFVLWASAEPLPAYEAWKAKEGEAPWRAVAAVPEAVWEGDPAGLRTLTDVVRGVREKLTVPDELEALREWWRKRPGTADLRVLGFAVRPKP